MKTNFKKLTAMALAGTMALSLSGCGSKGTDSAQGSGEGSAGAAAVEDLSGQEPYTVKWFFPCANMPTNVDKVEEAVNSITVPAINVTVDFECMNIANYENQVTLLTSSGEKLDIFAAFQSTVTNYYENGSCIPITEYVEQYGQDIISTVNEEYGETYLESFRIDGELYSVPTMHPVVNQTGIEIAQYVVDELDLREELDQIETLADLTPILEKIKAAYPDMYPISGDPGLSVLEQYLEGFYDFIGDDYAVIDGYKFSEF